MESELLNVDRRTDGRIGGHGETNSRFSQFCKTRLKTENFTAVIQ